MGFIKNYKSAKVGIRKAERDIKLVRMFMEEHNQNPPEEIASRFFMSLGDDLDQSSKPQMDGYRMMVKPVVARLSKQFEEPEVYRVEVPREFEQYLDSDGNITPQFIAEVAKLHGHETWEEWKSCETLMALSDALDQLNRDSK